MVNNGSNCMCACIPSAQSIREVLASMELLQNTLQERKGQRKGKEWKEKAIKINGKS